MAKDVKIYSTPTCVYCKMAKELFAKNNVQYKDMNVAQDLQAREDMVEKSGQMGVPVIDIDGSIVVGFDEVKLKELLGI
ncbi:NrdH-redoxin [Candidatus Giovannonibacteria bacterium]|nr:NrdH-redoxin [Candidatus Giovannonibacteria bacterium]